MTALYGPITSTSGNQARVASDLVVVTDEDVNGRQEQLKHRLPVTLFHLKTQTFEEAGRTFRTLAAAVLEQASEKTCGFIYQAVFTNKHISNEEAWKAGLHQKVLKKYIIKP